MSFLATKSHSPSVLYSVTDKGVTTGEEQGLLHYGRVIPDHIHNKLHIPRLSYLSEKQDSSLIDGFQRNEHF